MIKLKDAERVIALTAAVNAHRATLSNIDKMKVKEVSMQMQLCDPKDPYYGSKKNLNLTGAGDGDLSRTVYQAIRSHYQSKLNAALRELRQLDAEIPA